MRSKTLLFLVAAPLVLGVACNAAQGLPAPRGPELGAPDAATRAVAPAPQAAPAAGQGGSGEVVLGTRFITDRVLVLTAHLELKALDAWRVADLVQGIALGLGGEVTAVNQAGRTEDRTATVTVRVPNERFQDALSQIKSLADIEVVRVQVTGEDRTEQFIDLDARLKAKLAEEQRYLSLLARAEKIDDILKIDQVLSQVRAQIEQLQGQLNVLKSRSSLATITVGIGPLAPAQTPSQSGWQPSRTFQAAATSLAGFLQRLADLAIWAFVWISLPGLALAAALVLARFFPQKRSA